MKKLFFSLLIISQYFTSTALAFSSGEDAKQVLSSSGMTALACHIARGEEMTFNFLCITTAPTYLPLAMTSYLSYELDQMNKEVLAAAHEDALNMIAQGDENFSTATLESAFELIDQQTSISDLSTIEKASLVVAINNAL